MLRTRRYCPTAVLGSYARRAREIDRVILAGFALGLSTRKVGEVLLPLLGRSVPPATVSRVARTLDAAVAAFHRRPLANRCKALMLDGVRRTRPMGTFQDRTSMERVLFAAIFSHQNRNDRTAAPFAVTHKG